jgi:hypothetical protein
VTRVFRVDHAATDKEYADPDNWASALAPLNIDTKALGIETFGTCSKCESGSRKQERDIVMNPTCLPILNQPEKLKRVIVCNYPCKSDFTLNQTDTFGYLQTQLNIRNNPQTEHGDKSTLLSVLIDMILPHSTIKILDPRPVATNAFYDWFSTTYEIRFNVTGISNIDEYHKIARAILVVCSKLIPYTTLYQTDADNLHEVIISSLELERARVWTISALLPSSSSPLSSSCSFFFPM